MPESCEVYHTREKKKPIFSARFELKVRGNKTIVVIGNSRESWDTMNCYQQGQTERKSPVSKLMQVTNAKLF